MVPTATYEAALKRAHDEHLYIREFGSDASGMYWQVVNPKYSSGWYTVRNAGRVLTCNCEAGRKKGVYCKHRAYAHEWETERRGGTRYVAEERARDIEDQNRADAYSLRYELSAITQQRDADRFLNGR